MARFLPVLYVGMDIAVNFYTTVLPITFLYATGTVLLFNQKGMVNKDKSLLSKMCFSLQHIYFIQPSFCKTLL